MLSDLVLVIENSIHVCLSVVELEAMLINLFHGIGGALLLFWGSVVVVWLVGIYILKKNLNTCKVLHHTFRKNMFNVIWELWCLEHLKCQRYNGALEMWTYPVSLGNHLFIFPVTCLWFVESSTQNRSHLVSWCSCFIQPICIGLIRD